MNHIDVSSVKGRAALCVGSGISVIALGVAWVKFPSLIPLWVLLPLLLAAGATFVVSEVMIALRVVKAMSRRGGAAPESPRVRGRTMVSMAVTLIACNGAFLYVYNYHPSAENVLALNGVIVVTWFAARYTVRLYRQK